MAEENKKQWYVVNTYAGHENRVKENLLRRIESMGLQDYLFQVIVAEEKEIEYKNGKEVEKTTNLFSGYLFVEMIMTDEAWYIVRNTSGVTGFIGSSGGGAKPFPLQKGEVEPILKKMGIRSEIVNLNFGVGDDVKVISGPMANKIGKVEVIDMDKQEAKILVDMLGTLVPMEVELSQLEKVEY